MRMHASLPALVCALLLTAQAGATTLQDQLDPPDWLHLSGSFRARTEWLDGQFRAGYPRDDYHLNLRTTLRAEATRGSFGALVEVFDSRAYFEREDGVRSTGEVNALEPVQALVRYSSLPAGPTNWGYDVSLGRFTLDLGSRRLIGRNSFRNTTNALTGLLVDAESPGGRKFTALLASPQRRRPTSPDAIERDVVQWDAESFDQLLWGVHVEGLELMRGTTLAPYLIGYVEQDGDDFPTRDRKLFIPGARLQHAPDDGHIEVEVEFAWQFGERSASTDPAENADLDVSAWLLHAGLGARPFADMRVEGGLDMATGDADPSDDEHGGFDSPLSPRRPDWGPTGLFGPLGPSNIVSPYLRLDQWYGDRWSFLARHRILWLHEERDSFASTGVRDVSGESDRYAGQLSEAQARCWIVPERVRAELGGAILWERSFLREAPTAAKNGDTVYAHLDLEFWF